MDKLDLILQELQEMKLDIKEFKDNQEKMQSDITALRTDNRGIHRKLDTIMQTVAKNTEDITGLKAL
ncbi:MAG: hypothetical protein GX434_15665 [Peptococcaceae bacterium]|nr:hypothetical protein [Peptococcaceae bacterium]